MSDAPMVSNVLAIYRSASAESLRTGLVWYEDAHQVSSLLAKSYHLTVDQVAGIIAALSPMSSWTNNKNKAEQFLIQNGEGTKIGLKANVVKAQRIYSGESPSDVLKGDKVRAFYETILDPTGDHAPVIDRHAFDVAVGERTDDKRRSILMRKGVYNEFAKVYRDAARSAGIGAAQMQAVTWVEWRAMFGISQ